MKKLIVCILLAFALWTIMFSPWTAPFVPFWGCMTGAALTLTCLAFVLAGPWWKGLQVEQGKTARYIAENILLGIVIAVALWGIFWIGDKLSQLIFPSFARHQVDSIYGMKDGSSALILSLLLLFIIGPAEEIFWRFFIQGKLADHITCKSYKIGKLELDARFWAMLIGVSVYALVHLFSLNFMLIMAALVCGVVWGGLYWLFPNRLPAIILSHSLWDAAVFIWFPIM